MDFKRLENRVTPIPPDTTPWRDWKRPAAEPVRLVRPFRLLP